MILRSILKKLSLYALILIPVILIGCGSDNSVAPESGNGNQPLESTNAPSEEIINATEASDTSLPVGELPDQTEPPAGTVPQLGFALGDPNLRATDPSTVSLASGQLQLIEFFAFW